MVPVALQDVVPGLLDFSITAGQHALRIALIATAAYVGLRFFAAGLRRLEATLIKAGAPTEVAPGATAKRVTTLTSMVRTIVLALVWSVVGIMSLAQIGLDITPILAGAGIVGLAVGFGAQNLVRDVISGFFIILENQVRIGDVAIINGTGGLVEAITFRIIVLRDLAGVVHVFPNGTITTLSNMTKVWSAFVIDVEVAYREETDRVVEVMRRVAEELRLDSAFRDKILEPMEIFGVDRFAESSVVIKARMKTRPIEQWNVEREYRRRLKKAFDAEGIEIPFPHQSLYMGSASTPFRVEVLAPSAGA
ncbi:MAG: mechanosensitive ion channel family protein [Nitrospirota bacterium]